MTSLQLCFGFLIFLLMIIKPIAYKPCIQYFPSKLSANFTSVWLLIGIVFSWPFFGHLFTDNWQQICSSPYTLFSILKGILLYAMIVYQQEVNKNSTSSSVFFGFIATALGSLIINIFFKEGLSILQIACICSLGLLGGIFYAYGDAKRLSSQGKKEFLFIIILSAIFMICDHLAISQIGWFSHLLFSYIFMFFVCLYYGISRQDYRFIFKSKTVAWAGIIYACSEFLVIYASVNILPVSLVSVFMRIAAPVVMIISAIKYHELSWKNQLLFGGLALIFVLPLILIKN